MISKTLWFRSLLRILSSIAEFTPLSSSSGLYWCAIPQLQNFRVDRFFTYNDNYTTYSFCDLSINSYAYHDARVYTNPNIKAATRTVTNRLGPLYCSYFCHYCIVEAVSTFPL